ncbi:ATPase subunit of ABC transporter with duplicated ATPase domains [Rhizobium aquaticum]|uniref:ATPase subunit of ABC transporter with duplicated ATPase domains n=1 Tax=Rhizobium aquaticum TaxID=1549636 RepID=A0ABV2J3L3_9HYPH
MSTRSNTPAITLTGLSAAAPDGHTLFKNLDLSFGSERTGLVGRNGTGKTTLLELIVGLREPLAGTVQRRGKIGYLRQWPDMPDDATVAQGIGLAGKLALFRRGLSGEATADELEQIDWAIEAEMEASLARLGLAGLDPDHPFKALSGGEQTRARLAGLLTDKPDFLLMDEPTNHLDRAARAFIGDIVESFKGGLLIVSHDRDLLDRMDRIVEITTLGVTVWGGNYCFYRNEKVRATERTEGELSSARQQAERTARDIEAARQRKEKRDAAGRKGRASAGQPKILLDAAKERAEGSAGGLGRLALRQQSEAEERLTVAKDAVERARKLDFHLSGAELPSGKIVLSLENLTGGPPQNPRVIARLSLTVTGAERIALEGQNGAGKTTLLRLIAGELQPASGLIRCPVRLAYLDQSAAILDFGASLVDNFRRLNPGATDNAAYAALARFHFRNEAARLTPATLSGGERLRAALACAIGGEDPAGLLLLDEPVNHLDIESVEAVEDALNAYRGAFIAVSHDGTFLENIGVSRRILLEKSSSRLN